MRIMLSVIRFRSGEGNHIAATGRELWRLGHVWQSTLEPKAWRGHAGAGARDEDAMELAGKILIAMPGMGDPRFERSVILVCAHSAEGAMGIILNKPARDMTFAGLLEHLKIPVAPEGRDIRVQIGGPVERGRGFVLHTPDWGRNRADGTTMVVPGGFEMTATMEILQAFARGGGPETALLALGYAGWGPGQLEAEIGRNDWLTGDADAGLVFSGEDGEKWGRALRGMGIDPLSLSSASGRA